MDKQMEFFEECKSMKLAEALCLAQTELKNPEKNKDGYGYKYAELASIIDMVKPVLQRYGLSIIQFPVSEGDRVGVKTVILHASGEKLEESVYLPVPEMKGNTATQAAGAAITYARRYALQAVLNISADDDTDAAGETRGRPKGSTNKPKENRGAIAREAFEAKQAEPLFDQPDDEVHAGQVCPKCGHGNVVERVAKTNGKKFLGCSAFPNCDFVKWGS